MPADPKFHARMLLSLVPDEVRKAIGADELNDRLVEAARLGAQANDPSLSDELRKAAKLRGQAVLRAQPARATRRQHAELIAKAAAAAHPRQAEAIRREAEQLVEELHPIAPRRGAGGGLEEIRQRHRGRVPVGKAKTDDPVPVFDGEGNLVGICDPDDITLISSPGGGKKADGAAAPAAAQPAGQAAAATAPADAQPVAKAWRTTVFDQFGNRYVTDRRSIHRSGVRKAADDLVTVTDASGRVYRVSNAMLRSAEEQARDTGPVNAGGTTGLGQPRMTGPDSALPGDGPQARRPGDAPGRTVVKAAGWADVHTSAGKLVGVIKQADLLKDDPDGAVRQYLRKQGLQNFCSVYDAAGRRLGFAHRPNVLGTRPGR